MASIMPWCYLLCTRADYLAGRPEQLPPDTVWQLWSQLSDFVRIKNRHCELWGTMPPWSLQED